MKSHKLLLHSCLLVLGTFMLLASCKKSTITHPTTSQPSNVDVYLVGTVTAANGVVVAAYWKNGVLVKVGDSTLVSIANSIIVNGTDVYVGGGAAFNGSNQFIATYWKNGVVTKLTDGTLQSNVTGMYLSGSNLYLSGNSSYPNGNSIAEHWVNTASSVVIDSAAVTYEAGIGLIGQDVYIGGDNLIQWAANVKGVFLKNGKSTFLQPHTLVLKLAVNGNDVYMCGGTSPDSLFNKSVATFWKNGIATEWGDTTQYTNASSITVSGTDVYMAGSSEKANDGTVPNAVYWKNGTLNILNGNSSSVGGSGIAVLGNDVYVSGEINSKPGYWLNGVPVIVGNNGTVSQIVVIPKSSYQP